MKSWNEDFVDEDTGEVVSIERNEVVVERETEITDENLDIILESACLHQRKSSFQLFYYITSQLRPKAASGFSYLPLFLHTDRNL